MRYLLALLMLTTAAQAECLQWGRTMDGGRVCMADDLVNRNPVIPETQCGALTGCGGLSITGMSLPQCEAGWSAVVDIAGQPMCARELRKPK